ERQLGRDEQQQQDRRVALERQPEVLTQVVGDEIQVTRAGTDALRLRALNPVFERMQLPTLAAGELQPQAILRRLDEDGHLVAAALTAVMQAVNGRADGCAEDRAARDELAQVHAAHLLSKIT